jgi:RNA polymerase sigma-70 factor (ECF subfamily)
MPRLARTAGVCDIAHRMGAIGKRIAEPGAAAGRRSPRGTGPRRLTPAAFAARFQDSSRALWCIAAGVLGDRHEAEDVVQEAALVALQKLHQFDAGTSFIAWMGRIVHFLALNRARRRTRSGTFQTDPLALDAVRRAGPSAAPAPVDPRGQPVPAQSDFDDLVMHALARLEPMARACLLLRTIHHIPYREIAPALGIPEGTAMSHVHRARRAMRELLAAPEHRPRGTPDRLAAPPASGPGTPGSAPA